MTDLYSGPGKLAIAMNIDGRHHEGDFLGRPFTLYERDEVPEILAGPQAGISNAVEKPWRFGIKGSRFLSRPF